MKQPMTNKDLRIKIAEVRGWTVFDREEHPEYYPHEEDDLYGCLNDNKEIIPNYPNSMDACMELTGQMVDVPRCHIESEWGNAGATVRLLKRDAHTDGYGIIAKGCGDSLPEAICKAYLEWKYGQ